MVSARVRVWMQLVMSDYMDVEMNQQDEIRVHELIEYSEYYPL